MVIPFGTFIIMYCIRCHITKFIQTINTCRGMNHTRHKIKQLEYWVLNHTDKLQKGGHNTKSDSTITQSHTTPYECQEITQPEDATHNETGNNSKARASDYIAMKSLLH